MELKNLFSKEIIEKFQISEWGYTENDTPLHFSNYEAWIKEKKHLPLNYLADERMQMRASIKNYFPEFQSAIVFLFSYREINHWLKLKYKEKRSLKISSYTLGFEGLDYHHILRERLNSIAELIKENDRTFDYKFSLSIDMHPVIERDLAHRAGIGWQGKNSMLITRKSGSFFIIASLLVNKKFIVESSKLETDHCGQCTRCIEACPTSAIDISNRTIIAKDCISTYTIEEFKADTIPSEKMTLKSGFIFGCDICQDVCPWNIRLDKKNENKNVELNSKQKAIIDFFIRENPDELIFDFEKLSNGEFKKKFKNTSFERSGKRGILKNLITARSEW